MRKKFSVRQDWSDIAEWVKVFGNITEQVIGAKELIRKSGDGQAGVFLAHDGKFSAFRIAPSGIFTAKYQLVHLPLVRGVISSKQDSFNSMVSMINTGFQSEFAEHERPEDYPNSYAFDKPRAVSRYASPSALSQIKGDKYYLLIDSFYLSPHAKIEPFFLRLGGFSTVFVARADKKDLSVRVELNKTLSRHKAKSRRKIYRASFPYAHFEFV